MVVKVISDYSVRYKGKVFSKDKVFNIDKDSAQALIEKGFVEEVKKEQSQNPHSEDK